MQAGWPQWTCFSIHAGPHFLRRVLKVKTRTAFLIVSALVISTLLLASTSDCAIIRVKTTGSDSNDGSTWALAKQTVGAAITAAVSGDEIWVAAGTYNGGITLKNGVALYGGFASSETTRAERNWTTNVSILDGGAAGTVVTVPLDCTLATRIDGFTIRNGNGASHGSAIWCDRSSATITNNTITANSGYYAAIDLYMSSASVTNDTITGNTGTWKPAAIYIHDRTVAGCNPVVSGNTITFNTAPYNLGAVVYCDNLTTLTLTNNLITDNSGGCMSVYASTLTATTIANNVFARNGGGAVYLTGTQGAKSLISNTIVGNTVGSSSYGCVYLNYNTPALVANNIIGPNTGKGIYRNVNGTATIRNNCVYGNTDGNYYGMTDQTGANGNISRDPKIVSITSGDWHIQSDSPCLDTGLNSDVVGAADVYGQARIVDGNGDGVVNVDMGAAESSLSAVSSPAFSVSSGSYPPPVNVIITCATEGADVHYTTNGVDPTRSDTTVASGGAVAIESSCTLKAVAFKDGCVTSPVTSATYAITGTVATPVFSGPSGTYNLAQIVSISCVTPGATIRYTTDGQDPTTSSTAYTSPIRVDQAKTLKAKAWLQYWNDSTIAVADYTFRAASAVLRVDKDATGTPIDGSAWNQAFRTIADAVTSALPGDELWVAEGTYAGCITMSGDIKLYGGFCGTESSREARDWKTHLTTLDGAAAGSVVTVPWGCTTATVIDGFTITNGRAQYGAGIYCNGSSATICNNRIVGNTATTSNPSESSGAGIYCEGPDGPSSAVICNNVFESNVSEGHSWTDYDEYGSPITVGAGGYGAAISASGPITFVDNVVRNNQATTPYGFNIVFLNAGGAAATVCNNTIVNNTLSAASGAFTLYNMAASHVANNIVAFNTKGVDINPLTIPSGYRNNCVYGNTPNYLWTDATGTNGNVSVDPLLVGALTGDMHLQSNSPCIDAGYDAAVGMDWLDLDGQARKIGTHVDIGADEYSGTDPASSSLSQAKTDSGENRLKVSGVVTAVNPAARYFYIEDPLRSNGIRVNWSGAMPLAATSSTVIGYTTSDTTTGERYVAPDTVARGECANVAPLATTCSALGGGQFGMQPSIAGAKGLSNIGLLVKVAGRVTQVDPGGSYFYIDDGSSLWDLSTTGGANNIGVRVACDGRAYAGKNVTVTGISSCFIESGNVQRRILVQQASDIKEMPVP